MMNYVQLIAGDSAALCNLRDVELDVEFRQVKATSYAAFDKRTNEPVDVVVVGTIGWPPDTLLSATCGVEKRTKV